MELAFYAIVAMFIIARLYSSLGKDSEIERHSSPIQKSGRIIDVVPEEDEPECLDEYIDSGSQAIFSTIKEIAAKDPAFSLKRFAHGAERAFDFIIQAINDHNKEKLNKLLHKELLKKIENRLAIRKEQGLKHKTTIVKIRSMKVIDASLAGNQASITIKLVSEQLMSVENSQGDLVEGNPSKISVVEDNWKFARKLRSSSPIWILCEIE